MTSTAASIGAASVPSAALVSFPQAWRILKLPQAQLSCFSFGFWKLFSGVDAFGFDGHRSSLYRRISTLGHRLVCVSEPQRFRQIQIKLKQTSSGTDVGRRTTCSETATGRQWWRLLVRRSLRRWIRRQRSTRQDRLKLVLLEFNHVWLALSL